MLAAALLLWGAPAWGSQSVPLNLQRMSREAGTIFVGRALDVQSGRDPHGLPATFATFEVELVLKGDLAPGTQVTIKQYGYAAPRRGGSGAREVFRVFGLPRYRPGRRYLLLLYPPSRLGFQSPVGLAQGAFLVGADGRAVNGLNNGGLFRGLEGRALRAQGLTGRSGPLPLRDLVETVAAMVGSSVDEGRLRALLARAAGVEAQAGPLLAADGRPLVWDIPSALNPTPSLTAIPYSPDRGPLGALPKAQADSLVADAFGVWDAVPDSSVAFARAGDLPVDVTAANVQTVLGVRDGISPIVYDADGSITAALNGAGSECDILGFAGPEFGSPDPALGTVITEASAVLSGLWIDGQSNFAQCGFNAEMSLDRFRGVFVHEFGHYINLDHTQVNGQHTAAFLGGSGEPAFPGVLGAPPLESTNTMFPIALGNDANTLGFDDVVSLATLYPTPGFLGQGEIEGRIYRPDGSTPFSCADVIVRSEGDPFFTAASNVSGALLFDTAFGGPPFPPEDGVYRVPGLPPGDYLVQVEAVNAGFTEGSTVGPCDPPEALPGPAEFYNGMAESADAAVDDPADFTPVTVSGAGSAVTGVDIYLNGGGSGGGQQPPGSYPTAVGALRADAAAAKTDCGAIRDGLIQALQGGTQADIDAAIAAAQNCQQDATNVQADAQAAQQAAGAPGSPVPSNKRTLVNTFLNLVNLRAQLMLTRLDGPDGCLAKLDAASVGDRTSIAQALGKCALPSVFGRVLDLLASRVAQLDGVAETQGLQVQALSVEGVQVAQAGSAYTFAVQGAGIAQAELDVYDVSGRRVYHTETVGAGVLRFAGLSDRGQRLANGVYIYRITVKGLGGSVAHKIGKLAVLR